MSQSNSFYLAVRLNFVISTLLLSFSASAFQNHLDPNKLLTQYIVDSWTTDNGLPNNGILDIEKTRDGYLWVATYAGLARFDGTNFKEFPELMHLNGIRSLYEDSKGVLWIGSDDGSLIKYGGDHFTFLEIDMGSVNPVITSIAEGLNGEIWVGTRSGMAFVKNGKLQRLTEPLLSNAFVYSIVVDESNALWVGASGLGLFKYSKGVVERFTTEEGIINNSVRSLHINGDGQLMVGTEGGLTIFDNGKAVKSYTASDGLPHSYINEIFHDEIGTVWLGTDNGLVRFRNDQFEVLNYSTGLAGNTIQALHEDKTGVLWVGTYHSGLNRLKDGKFTNYGIKEGLIDELVHVVHYDEEKIWIGSADGLSYLDEGKVVSFRLGSDPAVNTVKDILRDSNGRLWIGTSAGLIHYENGAVVSRLTMKDGLSNNRVRRIAEAENGDLWVGTAKGLNRYDYKSGKIQSYGIEGGLTNEFVLSLLVDSKNQTWVGTNGGGLYLFKDNQFRAFTESDGLNSNIIFNITEDDEGNLWVGTNAGLSRFDGHNFSSVTKDQGLPSNTVFQIIINDHIWLFMDKGLVRIEKEKVDQIIDGKRKFIDDLLILNKSEGMRTDQITGVSISDVHSNGNILIATLKGLSILNPSELQIHDTPTVVKITSVVSDGKELENLENIKFLPGTRYNEFHYAGLDFYAPDKIEFKYRLKNFDDDWVEVGTRRIAYYSYIPPGEYIFQVLASNSHGVWNETPEELYFYQEAYFYESKSFYVVLGMTLCISIFLIYRARVGILKSRNRQLQELVSLRTEDIQKQNKELKQLNHIKDRLFSIISHDLRSPINSCYSLLDIMSSGELSDTEFKQIGKSLTIQIADVKDLLNDLLNWSRSQLDGLTVNSEKLHLKSIVDENFKLFEIQASRKRLKLRNELSDVEYVLADLNLVKAIVRNLLSNAIKFSKPDGEIVISNRRLNGMIEVSVSDNGVGISEENQAKILNKQGYSTLGTNREKGTGIGLILVWEFVEKNNGVVKVESVEGKGSTFKFTLPVFTG